MNTGGNAADSTRRQFIRRSAAAAAGAAILGRHGSAADAHESETIRLALIGCGGRGAGAVGDALSVRDAGPVKLHAIADLSENRVAAALKGLREQFGERIDVTPDREFAGFDAYRKAIDLLRPGDIAMCTTRSYIRPIHVEYAVGKGINVFMEKPFASDPAGLKRMMRAGQEAERKGVKIAAGLQCRHSPARQALIEKIRAGELGDITLIRANRLGGAGWLEPRPQRDNTLMSQLLFGRIHLFWVGSGHMVDNLIHQIDECCWIKDAWPVSVDGMGGRVPHSQDAGQNIDVYSMEYTFPDGTKAFCGFRRIDETRGDFATYLHGTKRAAQFSGQTHAATVHMFKDQRIAADNIAWTPTPDAFSPWQYEWNEFLRSIRTDRHHNEAIRAVHADYVSLMGRAACHTGQTVTLEQVMNSDFGFCSYLDDLSPDSPPPVEPDEQGCFPVPIPGLWREL